MATIDTRDLSTELDELEALEDDDAETLDDEQAERLYALKCLREEVGQAEFDDGATLIPESDFEDYAREFAEDIGAIPDDVSWPLTCIDWERAASELETDYTSITFDGSDYFVRV